MEPSMKEECHTTAHARDGLASERVSLTQTLAQSLDQTPCWSPGGRRAGGGGMLGAGAAAAGSPRSSADREGAPDGKGEGQMAWICRGRESACEMASVVVG